jgi:hypothetical protein
MTAHMGICIGIPCELFQGFKKITGKKPKIATGQNEHKTLKKGPQLAHSKIQVGGSDP